jgi:hypothetical protein
MSEGQGKRRIGQGMKPRDKQAEDKHSHPLTHKDHTEPHEDCEECAAAVPTTEGQPESIIEPILARQEGEQSDDHLEPETVQNLDSEKTASVAQSDGWNIEELMLQSAPEHTVGVDTSSGVDVTVTTVLTPAEMDATAEKIGNQFVAELAMEPCECHDAEGKRNWPAIMDMVDKQRIIFAQSNPLGLQPDGSYKVVTTIPEGYWQAVKDWAESDGVTPEDWINRQLSGYLENWGSPAKGR